MSTERYGHKLLEDDYTCAYGGDPVKELDSFRSAVEKAMRGVKTVGRDQRTAWVFMEDNPMAMGYIGYGDFQSSVVGDPKYVIYARDVRNCKYGEYSEQYYMRMAVNIDVAVKHAKRFMRKYTTDEIAEVFARDVKKAVATVISKATTDYRNAQASAGVSTNSHTSATEDLMSELFNMVRGGHTFVNAELDKNVRDLMVKKSDADRFKGQTLPLDFLRVYKHYDGMRVDIARIADIRSYTMKPMYEHKHTYLANDLPDDLAGKVAVMSMCEDEHFVEGVGYRVNEAMFYLYVEDVTT